MPEESSTNTESPERDPAAAGPETRALELILARNLVSIISLPAFLVDTEGQMVFYNDAAADVIGSPFEEIGTLPRDEWNARFGPFDEKGDPVPAEELPLTIALREGHPAYGRFSIRGDAGPLVIETGAIPLQGPAGYHGSLVVFWVVDDNGAGPG
jgi:PAS domain-containing protein